MIVNAEIHFLSYERSSFGDWLFPRRVFSHPEAFQKGCHLFTTWTADQATTSRVVEPDLFKSFPKFTPTPCSFTTMCRSKVSKLFSFPENTSGHKLRMFPSPKPILSLKMFVRMIVQISLARSFLAVQSACADSNFRQDIMLNMFVIGVCGRADVVPTLHTIPSNNRRVISQKGLESS